MEEMIKKSPLDLFAAMQETYEEAAKRHADENKTFTKIKHFHMDALGKYTVRILPLAPDEQANASADPKEKIGYAYPTKTLLLQLENANSKEKKNKSIYVSITHSSYSGISVDLVDTYMKVAQDLYGDDEVLMKKIKSSSFNKGLKWRTQRSMYVLDIDNRGEGIQLLSLSYPQYKELEDRKIDCWAKLAKKNPKCPCPISHFVGAYPVEITRQNTNGTTSYTFNIDVLADEVGLTEAELVSLLEAPRLPDVLYRYTRYQFEATIEFLKQYDEAHGLKVMESEEIKDAMTKISMELPADDKSHFSFNKGESKNENGETSNDELTIDSLWDRWEDLKERGIGDKSDEGQELRDDIRAFIDENDLDVRFSRTKTNQVLLEEIEIAMENDSHDNTEESNEEHEEESEEPENNEEQASEEYSERNTRGKHNDDTNEPALEPEGRRTSRPARRRAR